jgi:hypothetical protein
MTTLDERFPEWAAFADAVQARRPEAGTWCEAWTVRDIVVHQTGNAEELARVLRGHLDGEPVDTRGFEEREAPYRALGDAELWATLTRRLLELDEVAAGGDDLLADTDVAWTGRTMKVPWFAEHMREELVLHCWDITGDDQSARSKLAERWLTEHSVEAVGRPLLKRGLGELGLRGDERVEARLRAVGQDGTSDDVIVSAGADSTDIALGPSDGDATLETDAAARVLLLWGRRPGDPSRICSRVGPEALGRVRTLLSGY